MSELTPEEAIVILKTFHDQAAVLFDALSAKAFQLAIEALEAQLAKRDRPNREKIGTEILVPFYRKMDEVEEKELLTNSMKRAEWKKIIEETVDQLLALMPSEEAIRKQLESLQEEIIKLNKKLDDREADLIEARRPLLNRIKELEEQIARNSDK